MIKERKEKFDSFYFHKAIDRVGSESGEHSHESYEIYYMKSGKCRYFIDGCAYEASSGDVIFIKSGVSHRTSYGTQAHSRILINFSESFVPSEALEHIVGLDLFYSSDELRGQIEALLLKIEEEYSLSDRLSHGAIKAHVGEILYLLLRSHGITKQRDSKSAVIEKTVKYIEENCIGDVRLSSVAREVSVSPEHLSRLFKKHTGYCFSEYVTKIRLERAEYMLKNEPGKSVSEVAFECGFNDGNYFSYKFRQHYGIPPSKLRKERE
jgi:AraC-like DNA-binding protein